MGRLRGDLWSNVMAVVVGECEECVEMKCIWDSGLIAFVLFVFCLFFVCFFYLN